MRSSAGRILLVVGGGFAVVAINSNDVATYPQDGPDAMARLAKAESWKFPFLFD